jgi:hypothetical protein
MRSIRLASMGPYPTDVKSAILALGRLLDDFLETAPDVAVHGGQDPYGPVSALNARLVNDVILQEGMISPAEATSRLAAIRSDAALLESVYAAAGISTHGRHPVQGDDTIEISPSQADRTMLQLGNALDLYTPVVDRYLAARGAVSGDLALPASGAYVAQLLTPIDRRITQLDLDSNQVLDDSETLRQGATGADPVQITQSAYDRILSWIGKVGIVNEGLKRVEAVANRQPASPTPAAADSKTPIVLISLAGLLLVGLAFYAAMD